MQRIKALSTALLSIAVSLMFAGAAVAGNCPVNNATLDTPQVAIGGTAVVNLQGEFVNSWDITYDGVTTNVPGDGDTPTFDVQPINGFATSIQVTANGQGMDPCQDAVTLDLDYELPVCTAANQSPDSTVTPVDVGTVITLSAITSGAVSSTIDSIPMVAAAGTPGLDNSVTWEAATTAVEDRIIVAEIANPDGEIAECSWIIDINCDDPSIVSVAQPTQIGITIAGTPDCTYSVRITTDDGVTTYDVSIGPDGEGTLTVVVPYDALIEVGQLGLPSVTDSATTGSPPPVPVPLGNPIGLTILILLLAMGGWWVTRRTTAS